MSDTPGPGEGKHTLKFDTTPKMSTYLVAFLVGDFKCTAGESGRCSDPRLLHARQGCAYRLRRGRGKVRALHYYNNYFGIPYPLKKLDLIALPDFEAGAMENFGAITYRETLAAARPEDGLGRAQKRGGLRRSRTKWRTSGSATW